MAEAGQRSNCAPAHVWPCAFHFKVTSQLRIESKVLREPLRCFLDLPRKPLKNPMVLLSNLGPVLASWQVTWFELRIRGTKLRRRAVSLSRYGVTSPHQLDARC